MVEGARQQQLRGNLEDWQRSVFVLEEGEVGLVSTKNNNYFDAFVVGNGVLTAKSLVELKLQTFYEKRETDTLLNGKVDKIEGKMLSSNDFSEDYKTKLEGLQNYDDTYLRQEVDKKVNIENNMSLMSDAEHLKLGFIENEAQVNIIEEIYLDGKHLVPEQKAVNIELQGRFDEKANVGDCYTKEESNVNYVHAREGYLMLSIEEQQKLRYIEELALVNVIEAVKIGEHLVEVPEGMGDNYIEDDLAPMKEGTKVVDLKPILDTKAESNNVYTKAETLTTGEINDRIDTKLLAKLVGYMAYQGEVDNYLSLPTEDLVLGHVYSVRDTGGDYVWTENGWDALSSDVSIKLSKIWFLNNIVLGMNPTDGALGRVMYNEDTKDLYIGELTATLKQAIKTSLGL